MKTNSLHLLGSVFFMRHHGSVPGITARHGTFRRADDPLCAWNSRNKADLDLWRISAAPVTVCIVHFLSGILVHYHSDAGGMLLFCKKKSAGVYSLIKIICTQKPPVIPFKRVTGGFFYFMLAFML